MTKRIVYVLTALALSFSAPVHAAGVTPVRGSVGVAEAAFSSFFGCEDVVVGVTVRETVLQGGGRSAEASVFGSINDICEFGTSMNFAGTAPLEPGAFVQDGVDGATLHATVVIDGRELGLAIAWSGTGEATIERAPIREDDGSVRTRGHQETASRAAAATGSFVVDGLDRASGNGQGSLSLIRRHAVEIASPSKP